MAAVGALVSIALVPHTKKGTDTCCGKKAKEEMEDDRVLGEINRFWTRDDSTSDEVDVDLWAVPESDDEDEAGETR
jgi:hypothetical protein